MPYIAVKAYPRDEESKKVLVEKLNEAVIAAYKVPPQAVTISIEEISPEDFEEKVFKTEIEPHMENVHILRGEKLK